MNIIMPMFDDELAPQSSPTIDDRLCHPEAVARIERLEAQLTLLRAVAEAAETYFEEDGFTEAKWMRLRAALAAWRRGQA